MRRPDWSARLIAVFVAARCRPYAFGQHDCFLNAAECAEAVTDSAAGLPEAWRGAYGSYAEGLALLKQRTGAKTLLQWGDSLWTRVAPAHAQTGDWALVKVPTEPDGKRRPVLMVVDHAVLRGAEGDTLPRSCAETCWRVE